MSHEQINSLAQPGAEKAVRLAAKLYECRDTAKRLLGDKYHERMDEYGAIVRRVAEQHQCDILQATIKAGQKVDGGMTRLLLMAAGVELLEPSRQGNSHA